MRKYGIKVAAALLLTILVVAALAVSGCGKKETTVKTPEGEVTVSEKGGEVTIKTEEGEGIYKATQTPPSEEELGVPVHPKAKYEPGAGGMISYQGEGQAGTYVVGSYVVDASFDDVVAWYKGKLGEPTVFITAGTKQASWYRQEAGAAISVVVQEEDGKVTLVISKASQ